MPGVAENWTVSPDGRHYEFNLRPTAKWSNSDIVTPEDFVAGLRRAVDPDTASPGAELLLPIRGAAAILRREAAPATLGVAVTGPRTLRIDLEAPAPYFPAILANAVAYPVFRGAGGVGAPGGRSDVVSNGAYRLVRWEPGARITLARNAAYWDAAHVAIPTVEYLIAADSNAELALYRAGALDLTSTLPAAQFESLLKAMPAEVQVRPELTTIYYVFNLTRPPFRDAKGLREALSLAIDREALTGQVLRAGQTPAYSLVPPGIAGYGGVAYAWRGETRESRLARARALYRAAGYSAFHPLRLRLVHPANDAVDRAALAVGAMWHETLGVEVSDQGLEYRAFLGIRADRSQWDVLAHAWNADYPDPGNFLGILAADGPQNDPAYAEPAFEALLRQAAGEADGARRLELLASAERRLLDDYPLTPLYYSATRRLVKPRVTGAVLSSLNHNYSKDLGLRR